jgi:hypothetical protein
MTERIKEVIDSNGNSTFFIQTKFIIWWTITYPTYYSKEDAEKDMNYVHDRVVKYHY